SLGGRGRGRRRNRGHARAARDHGQRRRHPRRVRVRRRADAGGLGACGLHQPHRHVPGLQACPRGDVAAVRRTHRQHRLRRRRGRLGWRARVRRLQARRRRPHPPARGQLRRAWRHRQRDLPRRGRDEPPRELHADPGQGRAGDARNRRGRRGGARDHARRPPRDARGSRGRRLLPRGCGGRLRHRTDARHRRRMDRAMIKRFHALYVGQIELENIGSKGTPADARRYGNERLSEVFFAARDVAQLMDELGYYALWTAEHHFQREGYECFPNLIQLSLWLATQTRRLKLGCAFNVLPMWHPIRLAEDYAMADIVTDGRVIMGVGRGYHSREVESFGAPVIDQNANRALFEEQVELMLKCFNEESFSHHGKQYDVPPAVEYRGYTMREITCVPRPKHLPVEVWMPIASSKSIDYMASKKFKAMITLNGEKILDDVIKAYRDACAKHGQRKELGEDVMWGAGIYLADTPEAAKRRVEPSHDERYKWFALFGFVRYADE